MSKESDEKMTGTEGRATGRQLYIVRCAVSMGAIGIFWCDSLATLQVEAEDVAMLMDELVAPYRLEYSAIEGNAAVTWTFAAAPGPRVGVDLDGELIRDHQKYYADEVTNGLTFEGGLDCFFGSEVTGWQPLADI